MTPYLIYCHYEFHETMISANIHALWWRNYEFVVLRQMGCPGCPTLAEIKKHGMTAGEHTSAFHYIFGMHTPKEVIDACCEGFKTLFTKPGIFLDDLVRINTKTLRWFYVAGIVVTAFSRRWMVVVLPVLFLNIVLFSVPIGMATRIFSPAMPFLFILLAAGITFPLRMLAYLLNQFSGISALSRNRMEFPIFDFGWNGRASQS